MFPVCTPVSSESHPWREKESAHCRPGGMHQVRNLPRQLQLCCGSKGITMTTITLNGQTHEVPEGMTVLEAARLARVEIPTLCHHEALGSYGACRVCVVEAEGPAQRHGLVAACT